MGIINVLSFEVANLIAAGEVVDRPASAIKEMIENSIDAGAKHITVEIQNGGITFMRISDDGCGMSAEDLPLAIKRHATSKIRNAEDLDGICTLGFRGEALAAISAVSRLRIISKTADSDLGAELFVDCGEVVSLTERGCSRGTTIIAEDLFANVPARRKFLKRDVTETTAVSANVEKIALSHPEIAFKLITDGQVKLETAGDGKLFSAIYAVFGRDFSNRLIEVNSEFDGISVKGFIGRSDNVKSNRNYENFYINKRFVKSRTASAAIEQAYVSYCPGEKFPVCVLFVSLNPARVDVNVHPAKLEVKFSNEKPVFEAIYYAVRQALENNTSRPEFEIKRAVSNGGRVSDAFAPVEREQSLKARQLSFEVIEKAPQSTAASSDSDIAKVSISGQGKSSVSIPKNPQAFERITAEQYVREIMDSTSDSGKSKTENKKSESGNAAEKSDAAHLPVIEKTAGVKTEHTAAYVPVPATISDELPVVESAPVVLPATATSDEKASADEPVAVTENRELPQYEAKSTPQSAKRDYRIVGEVFNSYIIVEVAEKMLLIDKHAAHERIIFEQLKQNLYSGNVASQLLMLPIDVMLMSDEVAVIKEYKAEIEAIGFEFTCSRNTVHVSAIPVDIPREAVQDMLAVVADRIKSGTGGIEITKNIIFEKALYQASCKAAIKAGREYVSAHGEWIVEKLMSIPDITVCPHGRPVAMELTKSKIDRQFERT